MKVGNMDSKAFADRLAHAKALAAKEQRTKEVREMWRTIHGMTVEFNSREKQGTPLGVLIAEAMQHGEASTAPR